MKTTIALSMLLLGWTLTIAAADELDPPTLDNLRQPQANRISSGAIDAADIGRLRAAGIKHVINLRTAQESRDFHEAQIAAGLGIEYHSLPIAGGQSLTRENAQKLDELLKQAGDEPLLIHCASGNRVGALIAVREAWINGRAVGLDVAGERCSHRASGENRAAMNRCASNHRMVERGLATAHRAHEGFHERARDD